MREQFGLVLIEAMACGLPVIAVDRGGPSSIVDDPETGWLVEPDDVDALAGAITGSVADAEERQARGRRARERAVDCYSWSHLGEELAGIVRKVGAISVA